MAETVERLACPLCEDYTGSRRSIEAHISGSTDEAHAGHLGRDWRQSIAGSVEEVEESDGQGAETREEPRVEIVGEQGAETGGMPPGLALVVATALLGLVVVSQVTGPTSDVGEGLALEEGDDEQAPATSGAW